MFRGRGDARPRINESCAGSDQGLTRLWQRLGDHQVWGGSEEDSEATEGSFSPIGSVGKL